MTSQTVILVGTPLFGAYNSTAYLLNQRFTLFKTLWNAARDSKNQEEQIVLFNMLDRVLSLYAQSSILYIDVNDTIDDDNDDDDFAVVNPLNKSLFTHQTLGVKYMLQRERQIDAGVSKNSITCYSDAVGSGKTYTIISLCVTAAKKCAASFNVIVVPHKLIVQWIDSFADFGIKNFTDKNDNSETAMKASPQTFFIRKNNDIYSELYTEYAREIRHGIVLIPGSLVNYRTLDSLMIRRTGCFPNDSTRLIVDEADTIRLKANNVFVDQIARYLYFVTATMTAFQQVGRQPRFETKLSKLRIKTNLALLSMEKAMVFSQSYLLKDIVLSQPFTHLPVNIDCHIINFVNNEIPEGDDNTHLLNLIVEKRLTERAAHVKELAVWKIAVEAASMTTVSEEKTNSEPMPKKMCLKVNDGEASTAMSPETAMFPVEMTNTETRDEILVSMHKEINKRNLMIADIDTDIEYIRNSILTNPCFACLGEKIREFIFFLCCRSKLCIECQAQFNKCPVCRSTTSRKVAFQSVSRPVSKRQYLATLLSEIESHSTPQLPCKIILYVTTSPKNFIEDYMRCDELKQIFHKLGGRIVTGSSKICSRILKRFNDVTDLSVRLLVATGISSCAGFDLKETTHIVLCNRIKSETVQEQIIGRGLRPNRKRLLYVYKVYYESEIDSNTERVRLESMFLPIDVNNEFSPRETTFRPINLTSTVDSISDKSNPISALWKRYSFLYNNNA